MMATAWSPNGGGLVSGLAGKPPGRGEDLKMHRWISDDKRTEFVREQGPQAVTESSIQWIENEG